MTRYNEELKAFVVHALQEDVGSGDHSTLSSIPPESEGKAQLKIKQAGILAGVDVARAVFEIADPTVSFEILLRDGSLIKPGDIAFRVEGHIHTILKCERLVLNILQRMSGIATHTARYVEKLKGLPTQVLDTRKTTPGMRFLEKEAVKIGGGENHRMGLYDMILLKDNHIDYAGGIEKAILSAKQYLARQNLPLAIEVEARNLDDVRRILAIGGMQRIMLDNFSIELTHEAVKLIHGKAETESSGNINLDTIRSYAECGVDFISVGALTHQIYSLDMSLKAYSA
jgi:nicotinate-nucleotide pyrophosphorylase (carboxylating)